MVFYVNLDVASPIAPSMFINSFSKFTSKVFFSTMFFINRFETTESDDFLFVGSW